MTLASLINALSLQVPFLIIPAAFDLRSSGQYFLAYRVLVLPASLVGSAVTLIACALAFRHFKRGQMHFWPKAARENIRNLAADKTGLAQSLRTS